VRPIFLTVSNDKFRFIEYEFTEPGVYSSIREVRRCSYQLSDSKVPESSFRALMAAPIAEVTRGVPYPQADSIDRIVSLLIFISESDGSVFKEDVAAQQVFVKRQADYYINAARYLGFVKEDPAGQTYFLTQTGIDVVESGPSRRTGILLQRITSDPVVRQILTEGPTTSAWISSSAINVGIASIRGLIDDGKIQGVGEQSTIERRAQTMAAWAYWSLEHIQ